MDVREKLVEIVCDAMEADGCIGHCNHPPCFAVERVVNALITHGVTVQEWISVKDRLPEETKDEYFLVVCDYHGKIEVETRKMWNIDSAVTHWMPLPQPPKGE